MTLVGTYLSGLLAFLLIDAVWLTLVMRPLFERHVGALLREQVGYGAAAGFYLAYVAGILWFCTLPGVREGAAGPVFVNGLILGFLAYGTYEFTNMATLKGWSWSMVVIDTGWGMVLTGVTAVVALYAARWLGLGG